MTESSRFTANAHEILRESQLAQLVQRNNRRTHLLWSNDYIGLFINGQISLIYNIGTRWQTCENLGKESSVKKRDS